MLCGHASFAARRQAAGVLLTAAIVMAGTVWAQAPEGGDKPATPMAEAGTPNLTVEPQTWDFGDKWSGEKAETTFTIKNTGTATLKIDGVKSSCGCTVAQASKKALEPGESEEIKVTYNTKKRAENVSQKIRIMTNDPDTPTAVFELKGHVKQLIEMTGGHYLNFGVMGSKDDVSKTVELECKYTEPMELSLVKDTAQNVSLKLETLEAGKRYKLTATTQTPMNDGRFSTKALLKTGLKDMSSYEVRISGVVQGPVSVSPTVINVMDGQEASTKTVRVTFRGDEPYTVTNIEAGATGVEAEIAGEPNQKLNSSEPATTTMIRVKLPAAEELTDGATVVRITTDHPEYRDFEVQIRKLTGKRPAATATRALTPQVRPRPGAAGPVDSKAKEKSKP